MADGAQHDHYDWIIVGSGFGGSVSALRLAERGYRVLVIEKGRRFAAGDFPKTNWNLRRWLWSPRIGLQGIFQMSFMRHVTIYHGVGVGGGSLVYANTLPKPTAEFFTAPSWGHLADWGTELEPHYATARRMLGSAVNPFHTRGDEILESIAADIGRSDEFHPAEVGIFFGEAGEEVDDPFFDGAGPRRVGCTGCGACMTGCRVGAKNTLDLNYLHLAEGLGVEILPEVEVNALRPKEGGGYRLETRRSLGLIRPRRNFTADQVVLAGGVMGTLPLLLAMREQPDGLPALSRHLGDFVRTNNEALLAVVAPDRETDFAKGPAITSILHTDDHSHIEPVRYGRGSGFFRMLVLPHSPGRTALGRILGAVRELARRPLTWLRVALVRDFAKQSQILLYMRTLESTLRMRLGRGLRTGFRRGLVTELEAGATAPSAFMDAATDLARRFAEKAKGVVVAVLTETLLGVPSTAHILGGCCMGEDAESGVIDASHAVHGYEGLYVIDGSAMSANPGVNPSLTITALAERAMAAIPPKRRAL
jgi:cholesterol oxidase